MVANTTSMWVLVFNMNLKKRIRSLWANDWEMGREGKARERKEREGKGNRTDQKDTVADLKELLIAQARTI